MTEYAWTLNDAESDYGGSSNENTFIDYIATYVDDHVDGWSTVDNDAVGAGARQILLKPTSGNFPGLKVAIFGGSGPNLANRWASSYSTAIYVAVHTNHPADTFDGTFTTSQILTGAGFVRGAVWLKSTIGAGNAVRLLSAANPPRPH